MVEDGQFEIEEVGARGIAVLRVLGELTMNNRREFLEQAEELLTSPQPKLVIDLSRISRLFSLYLGSMLDIAQKAKQQDKVFSVLVTRKLADLFAQANLSESIPLVVVDKG